VKRIALVTGSNRGIGRAIAERLIDAGGHDVIVTARSAAEAARAGDELGVRGVPLDVTKQASVDTLRAAIPRVDVLVNNAGAAYDEDGEAWREDIRVVEQALAVNLVGAWRMVVACAPGMRERGWGRIVNVSSGAGSFDESSDYAPAYSVSKAGLNMMTVQLAASLRGSGVLVNACCPGWVRTDMGGPSAPRSPEEGADTPAWLATLPDEGPTGGFFRDREPIPW
jgi:NAD(P)-dependent dehydrogenase (short-subunit alcohol dehydrogenase family)